MTMIKVTFEEPAWPDLQKIEVIHVQDGMQIAGLVGGMESGEPSIVIRFDLPDGKAVVGETSLRMFLMAADLMKARFGDPRLSDH